MHIQDGCLYTCTHMQVAYIPFFVWVRLTHTNILHWKDVLRTLQWL